MKTKKKTPQQRSQSVSGKNWIGLGSLLIAIATLALSFYQYHSTENRQKTQEINSGIEKPKYLAGGEIAGNNDSKNNNSATSSKTGAQPQKTENSATANTNGVNANTSANSNGANASANATNGTANAQPAANSNTPTQNITQTGNGKNVVVGSGTVNIY